MLVIGIEHKEARHGEPGGLKVEQSRECSVDPRVAEQFPTAAAGCYVERSFDRAPSGVDCMAQPSGRPPGPDPGYSKATEGVMEGGSQSVAALSWHRRSRISPATAMSRLPARNAPAPSSRSKAETTFSAIRQAVCSGWSSTS